MSELHQRIAASFNAQGLMTTLGARLVLVQDGEVHIELPFSPHLTQQQGFVHAGVVTSIVDNACGYAALTRSPPGCEIVTAEFKTVGRVQNAGRMLTVCTGEVRAFAGDGPQYKLVALMQATMVNVPANA